MRVLVAGIVPSGGPIAADRAAYADEVAAHFAGTPTALGGFLAVASEVGLDTLPLAAVATNAAGVVDRELLETVRTRIFSELRGWKVDAVYLALPGATPISAVDIGPQTSDGTVQRRSSVVSPESGGTCPPKGASTGGDGAQRHGAGGASVPATAGSTRAAGGATDPAG